ncbi:hypothetical protein O1611_g2074 [Lasiodiplodia mahajangana]|uniref:Uncharacterized protein n=1 Tax=Lasiodiplodia mahajangana TaxID=1108764 RepID=A0ACC2JVP6_9PEZI|nr:hypothetical protein O1611_g2074 [Lasiodiplodia mahajangana]
MAVFETKPERRLDNYIATLDRYEREQYMPNHGASGDFWTTRHMVRSHPVNLDQVTARLLELPADYNAHPRPYVHSPDDEGSPRRPSTDSDVTLTPPSDGELERRNYYELVNDGGRPLYPIHLLDDVARKPRAHQDMLQAWLDHPDSHAKHPCWEVFGEQLYSWQCFRKWQTYSRGRGGSLYEIGGETAYEMFFYYFRRQAPTHTSAVQNLLAQYNFTRPTRLDDDPKQQDKLATWIEYLAFTCSIHYRYARSTENCQPEFDKAWKTLLDSNVLRPSETRESICNIKSAIERREEREEAQHTVNLAREASVWEQIPEVRRVAAQSTLEEAKKSLAVIARRDDMIMDFNITVQEYKRAAMLAERWNRRVQWIMEQVPLVEAEPAVLETASNSICGTKRGRSQESTDTQNKSIKKRRVNTDKEDPRISNSGDNSAPNSNKNNGAKRGLARSRTGNANEPNIARRAVRRRERSRKVTEHPESRLLRSNSKKTARQVSATNVPLRRSARIAARQQLQNKDIHASKG